MDFAARRPAPMARITVAPPVTMSPPAKTPGRFVACVDSGLPSSAAMLPHLLRPRPGRGLRDDRVRLGAERVDDRVALEVLELARRARACGAPSRRARRAPSPRPSCPSRCRRRRRRSRPARGGRRTRSPPPWRGGSPRCGPGPRPRCGGRRSGPSAAPRRFETRRQSMAVLPAPMTTTLFPMVIGRVLEREHVPAHEVHAGEELVRRVDLARELAGDAEEGRGARADAEEHRVVALLLDELRDGEGLADDLVGLDLHALVGELLHLAVDDVARQAEGRDAVLEHAAHHVERLVDRDVGAVLHEVGGGGEAGGAGAADGDLAELLREARRRRPASASRCRRRSARAGRCRPTRPSSSITHCASHCDSCGQTRPQIDGKMFASLMTSRAPSRSRTTTCRMKRGMSIDTGQPDDAGRLRALDAALRLAEGVLERVAEVHLLEVARRARARRAPACASAAGRGP